MDFSRNPIQLLFSPTGGIRYHFRALTHQKLWSPFQHHLKDWLMHLPISHKKLVLFGPSAGYCIPNEFLQRFDLITAIDPDPVARKLFSRKSAHVKWHHENFFHSPETLPQRASFLNTHPDAFILFSNILGQLKFASRDWDTMRPRIRHILKDRAWASFHDRVSGSLRPQCRFPLLTPARLSDNDLIQHCFSHIKEPAELTDHATDGLFSEVLPHNYFCWTLTRTQIHIIEAVHHE